MTTLSTRASTSIWALLFGDALAMPFHWYYNAADIDAAGKIDGYRDCGAHPAAYMKNPDEEPSLDLVGKVILKGKREFWGPKGIHYHNGMKAGENTLNALCARLLIRSIASTNGEYDAKKYLDEYITYLTTEGAHNDTYAESYHRDFFAKFAKGVAPENCCGDETSGTNSVGGLVSTPIIVIANHKKGADACVELALKHLHWTHQSKALDVVATAYVRLLHAVLGGADLKSEIEKIAPEFGVDLPQLTELGAEDDRKVIAGYPKTSCGTEHSFPAVLYLAYKYATNPYAALVANVWVGGENCHRGSVLGALLGAGAVGGLSDFPSHLHDGLVEKENIAAEIRNLIDAAKLE